MSSAKWRPFCLSLSELRVDACEKYMVVNEKKHNLLKSPLYLYKK